MLERLARLDSLPRLTIYIVLFTVAAIPFLLPIRLPLYIWKETRNAYQITGKIPDDKVVAICSNWNGSNQGELWSQYEAIVTQCMLSGKKLVVFSVDADPIAPQFAENINEFLGKRYGKVYGKDWVNLGLSRGAPLTFGAIGRNVKAVYQHDYHNNSTRDYEKLPIMRNVNSARDFGACWMLDYTPDLNLMVFLDPSQRVPIMFGCAGITSSIYYPYISSGQLKGMTAGTRGGAEYEQMLKEEFKDKYQDREVRGRRLIVPLAFGNMIVILFIVVGNVGMVARRRLVARDKAGSQ